MPIKCPISFPRLTEKDMREIDYAVMRHAYSTHSKLGRLCDESVYQRELLNRLLVAGIQTAIEVPITLAHRDFSTQFLLDLVVSQRVIYELKTVATLTAAHNAQLLNYLFSTNSTRGKLINFRPHSVETRFVNTSLDDAERRRYCLNLENFSGNEHLALLIRELIDDWGTGLDASLYRQAILYCFSKEVEPEQMVQMRSDDQLIGKQRFHLLDTNTALGVTTFSTPTASNAEDFRKLIAASPLGQIEWLNVSHHHVNLCTIRNHRQI